MLSDKEIRNLAKAKWHDEGECEVDDNAPVSIIDAASLEPGELVTGAYVQAWVWVDFPEPQELDADVCSNCGGSEDNIQGCTSCCRDCGFPCSTPKDGEGFHAE